jgi:hypothetical protein
MLEPGTYGNVTILPRTTDDDVRDRFWDDYDTEEETWSRGQEWYDNGYSMSDFI